MLFLIVSHLVYVDELFYDDDDVLLDDDRVLLDDDRVLLDDDLLDDDHVLRLSKG